MAQPQLPTTRNWRFEIDFEGIGWLTDEQKKNIFECNCRRVYTRAFRTDEQC